MFFVTGKQKLSSPFNYKLIRFYCKMLSMHLMNCMEIFKYFSHFEQKMFFPRSIFVKKNFVVVDSQEGKILLYDGSVTEPLKYRMCADSLEATAA